MLNVFIVRLLVCFLAVNDSPTLRGAVVKVLNGAFLDFISLLIGELTIVF